MATIYLGTYDGTTWTDQAKDISAHVGETLVDGGLVKSKGNLFVEVDQSNVLAGHLLQADSTLTGTYVTVDSGTEVKSLWRNGGLVSL